MATQDDSQNISYQVIAAGTVCTVLAVLAVILRLISRLSTVGGLGKDDHAMVFAVIVYTVYEIFASLTTKYGQGRHIWTLDSDDTYHLSVYTLVAECLNNLLIPVVETSVLLFYNRIFPQKGFRVALWIVGGWVWATKFAFILVTIFRCIPVSHIWDPAGTATCVDFLYASMIAAVFNVVTNLVVLLMPVPLIWRLKLRMGLRIQIIFAFTVGATTCITSIVRIKYTSVLVTQDVSWEAVPLSIACTIEGCLFIISGCVPTYVALLASRNRNSKSQKSITNDCSQKHWGRSQDVKVSSLVLRGEEWPELNNLSSIDQVKITTEITTTYEAKDCSSSDTE